ncbi:vesicle coat protein involved in golgi to plasma membrane transport domain-containing protein [Hirsutella rhossiliensis]|uniref:Vesicle coat protein involved in golgi to plasma membrane transport domain-containing protein n=1 Tax=Hirsutella rhossiliensis TaxID=111463 RepID=A0A9P8SKE3_9HYPO|nr:vesicle coat protein involved in golgi to plasma membrane transport domain-containing protein [Hirsutella rhossiliensis]KAH0964655.1 vesicle coat protein involved in golgi to plasma membrane transport domain-containing protein [Hirsutella rhossiliensis]
MVTEGLGNPCSVCFDDSSSTPNAQPKSAVDGRPRSSAPTSAPDSQSPAAALNDALRELHIARSASVPASEQDAQAKRAALRHTAAAAGVGAASTSALESVLDSLRPGFPQHSRRDSSFRRTYDETVTKKQGPCDNCAMTLPRRQTSAGSSREHATDTQRPTLRTRTPIERVFGAADQASPPSSQSSSDTDGDEATRRVRNRRAAMVSSRTTSCSSMSTSSDRSAYHFHYINYTSTHEPIQADSFSLVRASCLRALSFETLPRAPSTSTPASSPQLNHSPSFVTTQSPGSAATGGAIFFGDAMAGYTTAYIFRIPDLHARGHKRVYAFLALSTYKERLAMKTFAMVSAAFRDLATWIQQLAEAEAERTRESSPIGSVLHNGAWIPPPTIFLTGGSGFARRMGGPGGTSSLKARGLAELVGQPDFFIELHGKFIRLLLEVGVALSS